MIDQKIVKERAYLIRLHLQSQDKVEAIASFNELDLLAQTLDLEVVGNLIQTRSSIDVRYLIGKGKVTELVDIIADQNIDIVIFDNALTISQLRNIESILNCKVMERTGLILEIFSQRAKTKEAKLQVELAQQTYQLSRLTRLWTHLSRIKGGIGFKGPGERQLETDRRTVRDRIHLLKEELAKVEQDYFLRRKHRQHMPLVSFVGYTNAGKSTLFNALTGEQAYVANQLFATLDPLIRKVYIAPTLEILASDTVGFIRNLPHQLVASFRSTLKEVEAADVILHIADQSDPQVVNHFHTVEAILNELNVLKTPRILVFNKSDIGEPIHSHFLDSLSIPHCYVSALRKEGLEPLKELIASLLPAK